MTTIEDCCVLTLPRINRPQGNITPVEGDRTVPFTISRVYYLYDIPGGETRGGHAHRKLRQLMVSALGSFDVVLSDGRSWKTVTLNRSYYGLYVPELIWREIVGISSGCICLVLASLPYDESEYIRDYDSFLRHKQQDDRFVS